MGIIGVNAFKGRMTLRFRLRSYYQKIILLCLVLVLLLSIIQSCVSFFLLRRQAISRSDALSEQIVHSLGVDVGEYFESLDHQLDTVYSYPSVLANLNTGSPEKAEMPARALMTQTSFFRYLSSIRIYNRSHTMKSLYTRTRTHGKESVDIYAETNASEIHDYIENETAPFRVFCVRSDSGDTILRVVKRIYQDMGHTFVGYIVCDIQPTVLRKFVSDSVSSPYQYAWISTLNGSSCFLSAKTDERVLALMDENTWSTSSSRMVSGNFYLSSDVSEYGVTVTLFTDEIELRENYRKILSFLIVESAALVLVFALFAGVLNRSVRNRVKGITGVMRKIENGERALRLPTHHRDELDEISESFNTMLDHLEIMAQEEAKAQKAFEKARYQSLQAQVNPHFLYNTLENIGAIASAQDCEIVDDLCVALSKMLRYSIETDHSSKTVTLRQELDYIRQYMLIMDVRMSNGVETTIDIPEQYLDAELPRLSIQSLVDNAIRYGVRQKRGEKSIAIYARPANGALEIVVEDNGGNADADEMNAIIRREIVKHSQHESIGILNIHERVQLLFGEQYGLRVEADDRTTRVILTIPLKGANA